MFLCFSIFRMASLFFCISTSGEGTGDNGKTCGILGKVSIEWKWHEVACDATEFRGTSPITPTPTTPTTTMTPETTTLPKPDGCVSNNATADTSCYFLNTTKVYWVDAK